MNNCSEKFFRRVRLTHHELMATAGTEAYPTDFSSFRVSQGIMNYCLGTRKKSGAGRLEPRPHPRAFRFIGCVLRTVTVVKPASGRGVERWGRVAERDSGPPSI